MAPSPAPDEPVGATPAPVSIPSPVVVEVVRLLVVAVATAIGLEIATAAGGEDAALTGAALGACVGYVGGGLTGRRLRRATRELEARLDRTPAASLLGAALGALLLGGIGVLVGVSAVVMAPGRWGWALLALGAWVGVVAGVQIGSRKGAELLPERLRTPPGVPGVFPVESPATSLVLVDSSAAIDGRLLDIARSGFLPGTLAVPRFVLDELQGIADAADPGRRRKGRLALETLEALRADPEHGAVVLPDEVPERDEVDAKLVVLAARLGARLLTTDTNLVRVAELQGVACLNLRRLTDGLRPALLPGDTVGLTVTREGRERGQGVGFLEDGTMIVVTDAGDRLGQHVQATVTSSVATSKGRLFFATLAV